MEKKTKLTISGSAKKSIKNIEIAKTQSKNAVVIEKQTGKFPNRVGSFRPNPGRTNQPLLLVEVLELNHLLRQNHPL